MAVKIKTVKNEFPKMEAKLEILNGKTINVGVQGEHAWLAAIHEYGCDIKPKRAKYLTVPCNRAAFGKRAADFPDLFFFQTKSGSKFLARKKGKDDIEFMFALFRHVKIPERSFLRAGFDAVHLKAVDRAERILPKVIEGKVSEDVLYELVGTILRDGIKDYARDLSSPPKRPITIEAEGGAENPLINTGDMINGIEYEVE